MRWGRGWCTRCAGPACRCGCGVAGEYPVSFALAGALKDGRLIGAALASAAISDRLTTAVLQIMEAAADRSADPTAVDIAALIEGLTPPGG